MDCFFLISSLQQPAVVVPFAIHDSFPRIVNEFLQTAAKQLWLFLLYIASNIPYCFDINV